MSVKIKNVLYTILSACILLPVYIFCHEGAHALVALSCGARIMNFSIAGAYVSSDGGNYNTFTSALLNLAGTLLPAIISIAYMCFYKRENTNKFYRLFSFLLTMMFSIPTGAWILVSVMYLMGKAPVGDDATKFLDITGVSPFAVMAFAAALLVFSIFLAWRRGIIRNYWTELNSVEGK